MNGQNAEWHIGVGLHHFFGHDDFVTQFRICLGRWEYVTGFSGLKWWWWKLTHRV